MPKWTHAASRGASRAREKLGRILHDALQEETMLAATLRGILGRATGPGYHSLHRLLGDHCRQLEPWLGEIAQRARACGAVARLAAEELAGGAEARGGVAPASTLIPELLVRHERLAAQLRDNLAACGGDAATSRLLGQLVDFHETAAWLLRTVLAVPEVPGRAR